MGIALFVVCLHDPATHLLSGQLLSGRMGMWQALIAEFAHPHLEDRFVWPSALGTCLANASTDRYFQCELHTDSSLSIAYKGSAFGQPPCHLRGSADWKSPSVTLITGECLSDKEARSFRERICVRPS